MSRQRVPMVILCVADYSRLQERGDCPSALHDWPLPDDYNASHDVAWSRITQGWAQKWCPDCQSWGWKEPHKTMRGLAADPVRVLHEREGKP